MKGYLINLKPEQQNLQNANQTYQRNRERDRLIEIDSLIGKKVKKRGRKEKKVSVVTLKNKR